MPEAKHPLKVFLCHAHDDKAKARELYRYLRKRGVQPWLDAEDLVGGQDWREEIPKAIRSSDAIIVCLSKNSINKEGYVQAEITFALEKVKEIPPGRIFLIPVRFEECEVPDTLERFHYVDLFDENGFPKLMKSLKTRAGQLERATVQVPQPDESSPNLASSSNVQEESEATEKAKHDKGERDAAERIAREKAKREAAEKAKREKRERQVARKAAVKEAFSKFFVTLKAIFTKPFFRNVGIIGVVIVLLWGGSLAVSKLNLLIPTEIPRSTQRPNATSTSIFSVFSAKPSATPTKTRTPRPTAMPTQITDAKGVKMVLVPAGEFTMGYYDAYIVNLNSYYIDKYEATNAEYKKCVLAQQCDSPSDTELGNLSYYGNSVYDSFPVVWVTRENAEQYCGWRGARLPTGEEWEKAARGEDQRFYPWGNQTDWTLRANGPGGEDGYEVTAPVGSFPLGISPYGVFDMAGNVSEFITDNFVSQSTGYEGKLYPLARGGNWYGGRRGDASWLLSYSSEIAYPPNSWIGFRCVRDAD